MFPGGIGISELAVIGVLAVLLFGSKLPEVARSVGQSYQQFRKGLSEIQSTISKEIDLDDEPERISSHNDYHEDDYDEPSSPKFVPPADDDEESY